MITVAEARARILRLAQPVGTEVVSLTAAAGRVLVDAAPSPLAQPPFDAASMDGYALRAADATVGARLRVIGAVAAGGSDGSQVTAGTAIRIFTGAPLPLGADSVLIQEDCDRDGDIITVREAAKPGDNIRPLGSDFALGHQIHGPKRLSAGDILLLAAMNQPQVTVARRPRVAIFATGDELVWPGQPPGPAQIISSSNFALAALVTQWGGQPTLCPIVRDRADAVEQIAQEARGHDLIVTLGGASVGDHDLIRPALTRAGLTLDFHKIAMRPGKPLMAGRLQDAVMLGLPGNPVSAMVCAHLFIWPLLRAMQGLPTERPLMQARLRHDLGPNGNREHYMRAQLHETNEGRECSVFADQDSSRTRLFAMADALVVRPIGDDPKKQGQMVDLLPLTEFV